MKVLLLGDQYIFVYDLEWGYKQLGWETKISTNNGSKESLEQEINTYKPDLIMTFGTPLYCMRRPELMEYLGERSLYSGYKYIHWDTDGILNAAGHQIYLISRTKPDMVFTICKEALNFYKNKGIKAGIMRYGVNPEMFNKAKENNEYKEMITYIASFYGGRMFQTNTHKGKSIDVLFGGVVKNGVKIDLWGNAGMTTLYNNWTDKIPDNYYHGGCHYTKLKDIYSNCYMNLAPQNGVYHVTKRTYDIIGSCGFALCYNTPGLNEEFEDKKDLIAVSSSEEALYYIEYYKKHREEYEAIKECGYNKVVKRYTYKQRLEAMLKELKM